MASGTTAAACVLIAALLLAACGESKADPQPLEVEGGTYIALGDSLSAGVGASAPETTFVALVRQHMGTDVELMNLGHSGDTSSDLLEHGHLDEAVEAIEVRNSDADESNDVRLVTLEIGGNDLLRIYFSLVQTGVCPNVETTLENPECSAALRDALDSFQPNFESMVEALRQAGPDVPLVLMTLYNPFSFLGRVGELGELSLNGQAGSPFPEGLNDIILSVAAEHQGVTVADQFAAFADKAAELISSDFIHPNDAGYRAMADAIIAAMPE